MMRNAERAARPSRRPSLLSRAWLLVIFSLASPGLLWAGGPGTWATIADMPAARAGHTATLLADGNVLIVGGKDASGQALSTTELFNPASGSYTRVGDLTAPVSGHTATLLQDGTVLIAGGRDGSGQPVASAQVYDPATRLFAAVTMNSPRAEHTATRLADGRVLVAGGSDGSNALAGLEIYDPNSKAFSPAPNSLLVARQSHTATLLGDGRVLLAGGSNASGALASVEVFNPADGTVAAAGALNVARTLASAARLLDGTVLVAGGQDAASQDLNSAEIFDPAKNTFALLSVQMSTPRSGHVGLFLENNGKVLIAGGTNAGQLVATVEVYDPVLGAFWQPASPAAARQLFGANFFLVPYTGILLASGGLDNNNAALASSEAFSYPTIRSDKPDYVPGDNVTLMGERWLPNETVAIRIVESNGDPDITIPIATDASGTFLVNDAVQVNTGDLKQKFTATASGQNSGWMAQTTFTDANPDNTTMRVSCSPSPVSVNNPTTCTAEVDNTQSGAPQGYPQGAVKFSLLAGSGTFSPSDTCTLLRIDSTNNSSCSVTLTPNASGTANVKGQYNAFPNNWNNNNATYSLTVNATVATTLVLNVSPNSVPFGSSGPVTFTATLTRNDTSAGVVGATINFTVDGTPAGSATTGTGGLATLSTYNPSALSVATHNVQASFTAATIGGTNFSGSSSGTLPLTVNKATPTITWSNPTDITYGTALSGTQLNATASVPGTFAYTPTAGTVLSAGNSQTLHVDFTPTDTQNYTSASKDVTINVLKATLTVTADNKSREYGDPNPAFTASYSGFKNGETLATSGVTGSPGLTTTATATSPASPPTYPITAALGTLAATNYTFAFVNGTLTITKAPLTVTADNLSRAYGDPNPTFTASYTGFKNGETLATSGVTGSPSCSSTATATSGVAGSPYPITCTLGALAAGNYTFTFVNGQLTVTKAPLTVTADNLSRAYGDPNPTFTASYTGFKNGETLATSGVTGSPSLSTTATPTSPVSGSPYSIVAAQGSLTAGNYTFTFINGQLTITKAPLTVTADSKTMVLNGPLPTLTATFTGFKNGETLATSGVTGSPSLTTTATGSAVGSYPITAAVGTLAAANYTFSIVNGTGTLSVLYASGGLCLGSAGHQILQPINADGTSVFKKGSTVPAKFRVCDANGNSIGTPGVVNTFRLVGIAHGTITDVDEVVDSTTPFTEFRWDPTDRQWIFNTSTKDVTLIAGLTYYYDIHLNDGSDILFNFGLK